VLAVIRNGKTYRFGTDAINSLERGDRIVVITNDRGERAHSTSNEGSM